MTTTTRTATTSIDTDTYETGESDQSGPQWDDFLDGGSRKIGNHMNHIMPSPWGLSNRAFAQEAEKESKVRSSHWRACSLTMQKLMFVVKFGLPLRSY